LGQYGNTVTGAVGVPSWVRPYHEALKDVFNAINNSAAIQV
jgi:hypothetical protein